MKHTTQSQQRRLEELQLEFQRLQSDDGSGKVEEKKEEQAMVVSSKCRNVDALFFYFVCELISMTVGKKNKKNKTGVAAL